MLRGSARRVLTLESLSDSPLAAPPTAALPGGPMTIRAAPASHVLLPSLARRARARSGRRRGASVTISPLPGTPAAMPADPDQLPRRRRRLAQLDLGRRLAQRPPPRPPALLLLGDRRELPAQQAVHPRRARDRPRAAGASGHGTRPIGTHFKVAMPVAPPTTEFPPARGHARRRPELPVPSPRCTRRP